MKITNVYVGGWFQRTMLQLTEIYDFLRESKSHLDLDQEKLQNYRKELAIGKIDYGVNGEEFIEEANTVVFAIGLKPEKKLIEEQGIELDEWGYIKIDDYGRTNIKNVYAGGDCTESKSTVCRALAAGKKAAEGIIKNIK